MRRDGGMLEGGGAAGAIAGALTTFFILLPFVLVVVLYLFFTLVTMVHGTDLSGSTVNVPLIMSGVCVITAVLVALVAVGVHFIGRSLTPAKRRGDD